MEHSFSEDPIQSAIYGGIKRDIIVNIEQDCMRSAIILIYCGIDAMSYLNMPSAQYDTTKPDFVAWSERYIRFAGREQLTGLDLYAGRCSMLHSYGAEAKILRRGECRQIIPVSKADSGFTVLPSPLPSPHPRGDVFVSIESLADALFAGIDRFLVDVFADASKRKIVEDRFERLNKMVPVERFRARLGSALQANPPAL